MTIDKNSEFNEIKDAILKIGEDVEKASQGFELHEQVEAVQFRNIEKTIASIQRSIEEILRELKTNRTHTDTKIMECHKDLLTHIESKYMTKEAITILTDKTLNDVTIKTRDELKSAIFEIDQKIDKMHAGIYKSAGSHLKLLWACAIIFYIMGGYIFMDFKTDIEKHGDKINKIEILIESMRKNKNG